MKKILIYIYVVILSLAAVPAFHSDGVQTASAASMNWYFTNSAAGANYSMVRTSGTGDADLAFATNDAHIWVSDEAANFDLNMNGDWTVDVALTAKQGGAKVSIEVGELSGSTFTSRGMQASTGNLGTGSNPFTITTTSHTIASGDYLAIRITCTAKSFTVDLTGSPTYASSPTAAPDYPGSEIIDFTVTDNGGTTGIAFGSPIVGSGNNAETEQGASGAVTLTVGAATNVAVNVNLKGTNFTGISTFLLTSAVVRYDDDSDWDESSETGMNPGVLTVDPEPWYSVSASTSSVVETYHWITIPAILEADTYTSTFTYQCVAQ